MLEKFEWIFIYLLKGKRGGGALVHVYVLEHIVSLNYRIAWWIFTKFGRDKVLMTPHIGIDSWAKSAQGWIQGGAKIGPRGSLLQRTSSSDRKATATYWMHSNDLKHLGRSIVIFGIIRKSNFWRVLDVFLDLVILVYFNAISIDFCAIKSLSALILCNFHLYKWENA